jgi:hypothetical protein
VVLFTYQVRSGAERGGDGLGEQRLAGARLALDQERPLEGEGEFTAACSAGLVR